jgi:hypothetical protein
VESGRCSRTGRIEFHLSFRGSYPSMSLLKDSFSAVPIGEQRIFALFSTFFQGKRCTIVHEIAVMYKIADNWKHPTPTVSHRYLTVASTK